MTEYDRREGLPGANYAQFCLELLAFVASHPALRAASRSEQISAWMADAADADWRHHVPEFPTGVRLSGRLSI
jgi:hypothetical protein